MNGSEQPSPSAPEAPCRHGLLTSRYRPVMIPSMRWAALCSLCGTYLASGRDQTEALTNAEQARSGILLDREEPPA